MVIARAFLYAATAGDTRRRKGGLDLLWTNSRWRERKAAAFTCNRRAALMRLPAWRAEQHRKNFELLELS
jgi:hypothetical protein